MAVTFPLQQEVYIDVHIKCQVFFLISRADDPKPALIDGSIEPQFGLRAANPNATILICLGKMTTEWYLETFQNYHAEPLLVQSYRHS